MTETMDSELERCRPWIESALALSGGTHLFQDVVECVKLGTMQFWNAPKGCMVTEILNYPRKKVFHIFLAGGDLAQIKDFSDSAIHFAKLNGCTAMSLAGRRGWVKALADLGWEEKFTTMSVEI
jgi:hypothetical protein